MLQNLFSSGTQPAGSLLHRVLTPSPQPATLEVSEILRPQIKAMGSILLGRREKIAFCIVAGGRNRPLGASGCRAAGSWSCSFFIATLLTALIPGLLYSQKGGFSISYQSEAKLDQTEPVSEKRQEAREDTTLITNPRGTLF